MLLKQSFKGKNILILGYGKSGQSAHKLLSPFAKQIFVFDKSFKIKIFKNNKKLNNLIKKNYFSYKNNNILNKIIIQSNKFLFEKNNVFFENNLKKILLNNRIHFCILSPGISIFSKEVLLVKKFGIRVVSELELGALFSKGKIFAITGTNGKTTTCHALHHIFCTANKTSFLCGNVGMPITEIANQTTKNSLIVLEVSSFQMETTKNFCPFASAILNLLPDHLDRHKTFENYVYNKSKIFMHTKTKKFLNFDDTNCRKIAKKFLGAKPFSITNSKFLHLAQNNNLLGPYNLSNLVVASVLAKEAGIKDDVIKKANQTFLPLNHRLKKVAEFKNITFVNDSKSTNIGGTLSALESINSEIILLLGGSSKNLDFSPLAKKQIFAVIGYGETLPDIKKAFNQKNNFFETKNLEDAFNFATALAEKTENKITILLSPASASFDEFTGYEQRGEFFESLVNNYIQIESIRLQRNKQY